MEASSANGTAETSMMSIAGKPRMHGLSQKRSCRLCRVVPFIAYLPQQLAAASCTLGRKIEQRRKTSFPAIQAKQLGLPVPGLWVLSELPETLSSLGRKTPPLQVQGHHPSAVGGIYKNRDTFRFYCHNYCSPEPSGVLQEFPGGVKAPRGDWVFHPFGWRQSCLEAGEPSDHIEECPGQKPVGISKPAWHDSKGSKSREMEGERQSACSLYRAPNAAGG